MKFFPLALVLTASSVHSQDKSPIRRIDPPFADFYGKLLVCDGIPIRANVVVDDRALTLACEKIHLMLADISITRENLVERGAELHIIGKNQQTSDLPELHAEAGKTYIDNLGSITDIDKRTRGLGALISSCGEENLLSLPSDRYRGGSDICIHEFAHDIMGYGFDPKLRSLIEQQYKVSTKAGLWKAHYAAVNPQEYFAELSMWYFGAHGEFVQPNVPAPGPVALRAYDPGGFALLDSLYKGRRRPAAARFIPARALDHHAYSTKNTQRAEILFINNTGQMRKVYWIDFEGNEHLYGTLSPFGRQSYETYVSHVWMLTDGSNHEVARFKATATNSKVELQ